MSEDSQAPQPQSSKTKKSRCRKKSHETPARRQDLLANLRRYPGSLPEEPFRMFFPLGIAAGMIGAALWPLYYWEQWNLPNPAVMHARLMIQGWFGAYILGFLGTALPRMLSAPRMAGPEAAVLMGLWILSVIFHAQNQVVAGDFFFFLTLLMFCGIMILRSVVRRDIPPPGFVLVGMGLFSGLAGCALLLVDSAVVSLSLFWFELGKLLLYHAFLLLPILGVGLFLFPRFLKIPSRQGFDESYAAPPGWKEQAYPAIWLGVGLLAGYVIEALGEVRWGAGLRAVLLAFYLVRWVPLLPWNRGLGTLTNMLRIGLICLLLGYGTVVGWPTYTIALEHIVFIGGFGLITMAVGSRVMLGHSGNRPEGQRIDWTMRVALWIILLGLATRVSADFIPKVLISHYIYAAICWVGASLLWAAHIMPYVLVPDPDDEE